MWALIYFEIYIELKEAAHKKFAKIHLFINTIFLHSFSDGTMYTEHLLDQYSSLNFYD